MSMFPQYSIRRRVASRLLIAVLAGLVLGACIGLGAHNAIWVAIVACVGIVGALAITPRPSRLTEIPQWELAGSSAGTRVRVDGVTRSSMNAASVQPTLVSGTVLPDDDVEYRASWTTSMTKSYADAVLSSGSAKLSPGSVPPRTDRGASAPSFNTQPGKWALIYPGVTLLSCAALLFGVPASAWHINVSMPTAGISSNAGQRNDGVVAPTTKDKGSLDDRLHAIIERAQALQPGATRTALSIRLDKSGYDYADFFDTNTGEQLSLYRMSNGEWLEPKRASTTQREDDSFDLATFHNTGLGQIVQGMHTKLHASGVDGDFDGVKIDRPYRAPAGIITTQFETDSIVNSVSMQARADGTIAEFFNPGDFTTSFRLAKAALIEARLPLNQPIFSRFEIRGTASTTPTMFAGSIQNSGGVLMDFATGSRSGSLAIVPGEFPELSEYRGGGSPDDAAISFNQVQPGVFESVRKQAMARGRVAAFDRNAIDIEAVSTSSYDVPPPFIRVEMSKSDAASGRYSMTGKFLLPDYH